MKEINGGKNLSLSAKLEIVPLLDGVLLILSMLYQLLLIVQQFKVMRKFIALMLFGLDMHKLLWLIAYNK